MKTIKEAQKEIQNFVEKNGSPFGYYSPMILSSLIKSLHNFSDIFNDFYNFKKTSKINREGIEKEIGNLLFNIICLANNYGIDLEIVLKNVISKL